MSDSNKSRFIVTSQYPKKEWSVVLLQLIVIRQNSTMLLNLLKKTELISFLS